jgi:TRAP-type transport system periplasmic protein
MQRKGLFITLGLLTLTLILILTLISGCSQTTPTPAPATSAAPAPAKTSAPAPATSASPAPATSAAAVPASSAAPAPSSAAAGTITLRYASTMPPVVAMSQVNKQWADKVEKDSGGRLKIQLYFSESLAKQADTFRAVQTGVADMAFYIIGWDPGLLPLNEITRLPFIGIPSQKAATAIHWDLYNKYPEMQKEFGGMKLLEFNGTPPDIFNFTKKTVRVPADIKGMKLIAGGKWPNVLQSLGAVPMDLGAGDWYTSLDRGVVEGHVTHLVVVNAMKTLELLKYHTNFGDAGCSTMVMSYIMNQDSWNKLPPDLQKVLADSTRWQEEQILLPDQKDLTSALDFAKSKNHTFTDLTPAEIKQWVDAAKPAYDKWMADSTGKGPAQAILDDARALVKKYATLK